MTEELKRTVLDELVKMHDFFGSREEESAVSADSDTKLLEAYYDGKARAFGLAKEMIEEEIKYFEYLFSLEETQND